MRAGDAALRVRRSAGVFPLARRGLLEVRGEDCVRFLQGQLTQDVAGLDPAGPRSGCYALALTAQGRIVADAHVLARPEALWLETAGECLDALRQRLERYRIADDVEFLDRSGEWARFAVEGPAARDLLAALGAPPPALEADACARWPAGAGSEGLVAAFGWSGEAALQLFVPASAGPALAEALRAAAEAADLVWGDAETLEVLRVEAGVPAAGSELSEDVLPAEAGLLERAVSFSKGCYTGQEVVARMHSRGRVSHRLVGLSLEGEALPARGSAVTRDGARVGELTSTARSSAAGAIALGYVRLGHEDPGTALAVDGRPARVAALPFVAPGGRSGR